MQALYAHSFKPYENQLTAEIELIRTVKDSYSLFLWVFSIFPELAYYREKKLEELKGKHNPTPEDLLPNTKFVDNLVIAQIENNVMLKKLWPAHHISWSEDMDFVAQMFHSIEETDIYTSYMNSMEGGYNEDKKFVLSIIENVFAKSARFRWFLGEKNINWLDDFEEALIMFYKNIVDFKQSKGENCKIMSLYKNAEDEDFCRILFSKTIEHDAEYERIIENKLQNWELDRVIGMDVLLMKMALCEFTQFPTIPVKVTLNEYIDLAKLYSSDKSKQFINGILDKIIVDLRDADQLNKTGEGLFQN